MREILFRAKTTKKEQKIHAFHNIWVEGDIIKNKDKWHIHPKANCFRMNNETTKYMIAHEVIPETVGQFTGLTDKNGKKIFEGDFLKYKYKERINDVYIYGRVIYEESRCEFLVWCPKDEWVFSNRDFFNDIEDIEVIGNIHDNPELLSGE